jgi:iron(III) transport system ATP-binding protein
MFQDFALFPHLTVTQNIRFGTPGGDATDAWIRRAIGRAGLAAWADAYPHTLSGGQQQRCALLRALAPQPRVLLLDEPFSGLDVTLRAQVRDETADFLRETGIATLVVTHDAEEAMGLADRLVVMRDGGIVQAGRPAEIYLAPADPFVAGLFGPLNRWAGPVTDGHVDTPLGRCPAPGLAAGQPALVLVRPEQIQVSCPPAAANATVVASRLLGGVSRITIETDAGGWRLDARAAGVTLPAAGERVVVGFDPSRAFVFPAAAGDGRRTGGECTQSLSG